MMQCDSEMHHYSSIQSYATDLQQCLLALAPMAKQLRLLASNTMVCALRTKQDGAGLRVLAQDLQSMNETILQCMEEGLSAIRPLLTLPQYIVDNETVSHNDREQNRSLSIAVHHVLISLSTVEKVAKKGDYIAVFLKLETADEETQAHCERLAEQCQKVMASLHQQMEESHVLSERLSDCFELKPTELAFH